MSGIASINSLVLASTLSASLTASKITSVKSPSFLASVDLSSIDSDFELSDKYVDWIPLRYFLSASVASLSLLTSIKSDCSASIALIISPKSSGLKRKPLAPNIETAPTAKYSSPLLTK